MKNNWLLDFRRSETSQLGEDGIIEKIFEIIGIDTKWCVEFGAANGTRGSNTWHLINRHNWNAVMIEPQPRLFRKLTRLYHNNQAVTCIHSYVGFEGDITLDRLLVSTAIPQAFDLLSIDIDGNDYHVWDAVTNYTPRVVVIEFNPTIPTDIEFIQPRDMNVNQGTSLLSLYHLAKRKGYELISATDWNAFFVAKDLFSLFDIADNTPHAIHQNGGKYETRIFQLFDGTLVLAGYKQLFWHRIRIRDEDIQILDKQHRVYPPKR